MCHVINLAPVLILTLVCGDLNMTVRVFLSMYVCRTGFCVCCTCCVVLYAYNVKGWRGQVLMNLMLDRCQLMQMTRGLLERHIRPCRS